MKPSRGTVIPTLLRLKVAHRDHTCVGPKVGMPGDCFGELQLDHVKASGGMGMKSPTVLGNMVLMCSTHHRLKTENGRIWRPKLTAYLEQWGGKDEETAA